MKYVVTVNGERHELELDVGTVRTGDKTLQAHAEAIEGTPVRLVRLGDRVHRVVARKGGSRGQYTLWLDGWRFEVEALDARTHAIREMSAAASGPAGPAPLVAPMPGLIVRVEVQPGDRVQQGQGLMVMEAMKMENELRAAAAATVKSVRVTPGTAVEKGTVLIEME